MIGTQLEACRNAVGRTIQLALFQAQHRQQLQHCRMWRMRSQGVFTKQLRALWMAPIDVTNREFKTTLDLAGPCVHAPML